MLYLFKQFIEKIMLSISFYSIFFRKTLIKFWIKLFLKMVIGKKYIKYRIILKLKIKTIIALFKECVIYQLQDDCFIFIMCKYIWINYGNRSIDTFKYNIIIRFFQTFLFNTLKVYTIEIFFRLNHLFCVEKISVLIEKNFPSTFNSQEELFCHNIQFLHTK